MCVCDRTFVCITSHSVLLYVYVLYHMFRMYEHLVPLSRTHLAGVVRKCEKK
jgi:hypothetical protein